MLPLTQVERMSGDIIVQLALPTVHEVPSERGLTFLSLQVTLLLTLTDLKPTLKCVNLSKREVLFEYQEQRQSLEVTFQCNDGEQKCSRQYLSMSQYLYQKGRVLLASF